MPRSPLPNASDDSTASWLTIPAPMPNVAFDDIRARITGSRRATTTASCMSARGRTRADRWAVSARAGCIGRRTSRKKPAATMNVMTSAMIAARRPNAWLNTPPRPAPTASMTPHVDPNRALALRSSSGERARLGTPASIAGLTNAASAAIRPWNTKATQMRSASSSSRPQAAHAWSRLTTTSRRLRSNASTTGPASGEARNDGSESDTSTSDTRISEPVASSMYPARATNTNQSPRNDTTCAQNTHRSSRFVRSRSSTAACLSAPGCPPRTHRPMGENRPYGPVFAHRLPGSAVDRALAWGHESGGARRRDRRAA